MSNIAWMCQNCGQTHTEMDFFTEEKWKNCKNCNWNRPDTV